MAEAEVQVIKAVEGPVIRDRRLVGKPVVITRKRVAAYVRVSTNAEEQLQSFQSQKEYYQDKISENREWTMVGIYADEGITGTKTDRRDEFLRMIEDCMDGLIDVVITKSVSRFSRNLVDTLTYTRMLKQKGVTVIFEKENIDTSKMESEMQLSLLSALAQNEVESLSQNVKMGVRMKMSRGEIMGFNGCLGYDYHPEDKTISVNAAEAETVRMIFDMYLQGYGANTIAKELTRLGKVNKKGKNQWTDSGVRGIIKNEKYKGDMLMGKTYTVDPISKRRLENRGEENQYYSRNHHEAIVSEETWDAAQEIRQNRYRPNENVEDSTRARYARKFALSSMCECGFCGTNLTRRSHHQDTLHKKPVWKCRKAANQGIANCPDSKAVDEAIIEGAFLEMFGLLAGNFDDVLDSVLASVEDALSKDESSERLRQLEKEIGSFEKKRDKLTDMLLDDKISKEAYDGKYDELTAKIGHLSAERDVLARNALSQKNVQKRMEMVREKLAGADVLDQFDRIVFESIVEKVIVGETAEDGTVDPYKLTFVLKGMENGSYRMPRTGIRISAGMWDQYERNRLLMEKERNVNIIEDTDGKKTVVIHDIRFKGKRSVDWEDVKEYLKMYVGEFYEIAETGDVVYIGSDLPDEYAGSVYTKRLKGAAAKAKANASQGIPEMIEIAASREYEGNRKEKHSRDAKNGWYRYETRFALPVYDENGEIERYNVFYARLLIRHASSGKMYLYDITEIKKETSKSCQA